GVLFVALGRRAAAAPLGANFEPLLAQAVGWDSSPAAGVDTASGASFFGEAASSLADVSPKGRAKLSEQDVSAYEMLLKWRDGELRIVPVLAGAYRVTIDGNKELRVAAPLAREIDLRPRAVAKSATSSALGGGVAIVDVSWMVALALLALVAGELVARAMTRA